MPIVGIFFVKIFLYKIYLKTFCKTYYCDFFLFLVVFYSLIIPIKNQELIYFIDNKSYLPLLSFKLGSGDKLRSAIE